VVLGNGAFRPFPEGRHASSSLTSLVTFLSLTVVTLLAVAISMATRGRRATLR
jgi:hypothetical protein